MISCMDGNTVAEDRVRLIARKIAERKPRNYEGWTNFPGWGVINYKTWFSTRPAV